MNCLRNGYATSATEFSIDAGKLKLVRIIRKNKAATVITAIAWQARVHE
jgi:hypothetical protein